MKERKRTEYTLSSPKLRDPLTFALVADLHNAPYADVLPALEKADAILIVGDLINRHRRGYGYAASFLQDAPRCAPTFYALGNHELLFREMDEFWPLVQKSDVQVLDNAWTMFHDVVLGALSAAPHDEADGTVVQEMALQNGYRLLMCHHPEYYPSMVAGHGIDLTVAGHAHGGQVNVWGHGLYSPGQGLLPRLTSGFYDDHHLLVSRGMTNTTFVPRWNNPCELVLLHLVPTYVQSAADRANQ